jgi:oligopeptide transport system substrate-binding protein
MPSSKCITCAALLLALIGVQAPFANAADVPAGVALHSTQTLTRNNGSEPESMDPAVVESVPANTIARDLFEGLTATDAAGKTVPGVAESWQQSNATTWVFKIRANAKFSNGEPITADDFVYAVRRFVDPKTASSYAATFGNFLLNGPDVVKGKMPPTAIGVRAVDKLTLEFKTAEPVGYMPELMANTQFAPLHKATVKKFGKDWVKPGNMVGNGAFVLKEWQVNSRIVLEKNPNYWDAAKVQLTRVTYLPVEDANADIKLFESGTNDFVYQLPPGVFDKLKTQYPKEIRNQPIIGLRYYEFQTKDALFKDVRVRKALSMVLDRNILAQRVTADGQAPAYGLVVKGLQGADVSQYEWAVWPMDQKVAEAKKLLAEAGVKPGTKISFSYNTSDYHKKMAIFAASEWKSKLGLEVETESMEFKVLIKKRHDGAFQMARAGWLADYNDVTTFLTLVRCDSDQNNSGYCDRKAEDMIQQGVQSADPAKRQQLLTQAAKQIMDGYPIIPLLQYSLPRLVKSYVGGYSEQNPMDHYRSKEFYIIKH